MLVLATPNQQTELLDLIKSYYEHDHLTFRAERLSKALGLLLSNPRFGQAFWISQKQSYIGYCILTFAFDLEFGGPLGYVTDFYITPAYRRQGLGRLAMQQLMQWARQNGLQALELQVQHQNHAAFAFYKSLGFDSHRRTPLSLWLD